MNFQNMQAFQDYLVSWKVPGNDCRIMKDHKELYRFQSGYSDLETQKKTDGNELYYFWSASKVITTSLALRLHEAGFYTMNEPLSDYMPEFKDMMVQKTVNGETRLEPATKPILIKDLFRMTAGFDYNFGADAIQKVKAETDGRCPTREIARAIAQGPLSFEPGEHWSYSLCHDVLGAFIEVIAGKRLRDYAKEVLFDPLGMKDTCYNLPEGKNRERLAKQYFYDDKLKQCVLSQGNSHILGQDYDSGGAGVVSSCKDYSVFADTIACGGTAANGYRYLSPATIELWHTNILTEAQKQTYSWPQLSGYGYGYGVRTMMEPEECGALSPKGEFGWGGAAGVWVIIDPLNHISLTYTMHMLNNQEAFISPRLRNILYSSL